MSNFMDNWPSATNLRDVNSFDVQSTVMPQLGRGDWACQDYFELITIGGLNTLNGIDKFGFNTIGQLGISNQLWNTVCSESVLVSISNVTVAMSVRFVLTAGASPEVDRWIANGWAAGVYNIYTAGVSQTTGYPFRIGSAYGGKFLLPRGATVQFIGGSPVLREVQRGLFVFIKNLAINTGSLAFESIITTWDFTYRFGVTMGTEPYYTAYVHPMTFDVTLMPGQIGRNDPTPQAYPNYSRTPHLYSVYLQASNSYTVRAVEIPQRPESGLQFWGKLLVPLQSSWNREQSYLTIAVI